MSELSKRASLFVPRPAQASVLDYRGGRLGISAVPGSGKTQTLSYLAALLVRQLAAQPPSTENLFETPEVLIVTFSNSAVENFRQRIARLVRDEFGLLPNVGYRVRTLHALANDIVRMRPALVGLPDDFQIADERVTEQVLDEALRYQLAQIPDALDPFLSSDVADNRRAFIKREKWPDHARDIVASVIRRAKDLEKTPAELRTALGSLSQRDDALLHLALNVYETYQRGLQMRNMVDFDDLIRLALLGLRLAPDFLMRLRLRWPFILEDEAQDSSELQEKMLRLLTNTHDALAVAADDSGNWVRVGDPNQAINTTFTTADPKHLRQFLDEPGAARRDLPDSGRSAEPIIRLANYLVDWAVASHPVPALRQLAFLRQAIRPTPSGDPQPNPTDCFIYLDERSHSPDEELDAVANSLARWLPAHSDWSVAVLVPENERGFKLIEVLKARGIPHEELLRSSEATRNVAGKLETLVRYLAQPDARALLADVYHHVWRRPTDAEPAPNDASGAPAVAATSLPDELAARVEKELRRLPAVEDFLYPGPANDWLVDLKLALDEPAARTDLQEFRVAMCRWLEASVLPIDQLVLTLGRELFTEPADLALTQKLAVVLASFADANPRARLLELADELRLIARNERRFLGFDTADVGYEPTPGVVTVATMHAAKGLEWDRVYLMALNNYSFLSAQPHDHFRAEQWYVRDNLNLEAETLARLESALRGEKNDAADGHASKLAREAIAAERLRLFYVGITRARKDLIMTWNYGRFGGQDSARRNQAAAPFVALHEFWRARLQRGNSMD